MWCCSRTGEARRDRASRRISEPSRFPGFDLIFVARGIAASRRINDHTGLPFRRQMSAQVFGSIVSLKVRLEMIALPRLRSESDIDGEARLCRPTASAWAIAHVELTLIPSTVCARG